MLVPMEDKFTSMAHCHMPAGEGPCSLFDILLRVLPFTESEQLEELTGKVFVRMAFTIRVAIEPDKHCRVT